MDGVKVLAENIVRLRCGGYNDESIIEYVERKVSCKWDDLTPNIRDLITNILDECQYMPLDTSIRIFWKITGVVSIRH